MTQVISFLSRREMGRLGSGITGPNHGTRLYRWLKDA